MTREASTGERARWGEGIAVVEPRDVAEAGEVVRAAEAEGVTLIAGGVGAHAHAADAPPRPAARILSSAGLAGVVTYEPDDFTIGVGAGMPLRELRALLAQHGQELAHDTAPGAAGTVGGLVARAPHSPRSGSVGPLHTLVLGVEGVRGGGKGFRGGGMVVKNVAGYQAHKLCVGAHGRTGLLTRVNFRLRSRPERRVAMVAACADAGTAARLAAALRARALEPACLALLSGTWGPPVPAAPAWRVVWMFEGPSERVEWLATEAAAVVRAAKAHAETADGDAWLAWLAAAEEPDAETKGIARLTVPATDAGAAAGDVIQPVSPSGVRTDVLADALTGQTIVRWSGAVADPAAPLAAVIATARRFRGHARLVFLPSPLRDAHGADLTPDPNAALAARVLAAFDPRGAFGAPLAAPVAAGAAR